MTPTDWTPEDPEGAELASDVCGLLADYAAKVMPEGAVERPGASVDAEFLIALVGFESNPSDETMTRLRVAFVGVMSAWEVARLHAFRSMGA